MNIKKCIRLVEQKTWNACAGPITFMLGYPFMMGFMRMRKYYPEYYREAMLTIKDGLGVQWTDEEQNKRNIQQLYENKERTKNIMHEWFIQEKLFYHALVAYEKKLKNSSKEKLLADYLSFLDLFIETWAAPLAVDALGLYTEAELLEEFLDTVHANKVQAQKDFITLCHPLEPSFMIQEHCSLLRLTLLSKKKEKSFEKSLREHQQSFFWIENNYKKTQILSQEYFLQKVRYEAHRPSPAIEKELRSLEQTEAKEQEKKRILTKYSRQLPLQEKLLLTAALGKWQDHRKEMCLRGNHLLTLFLGAIADKTNYRLEDLKVMSPKELYEMVKTGKAISTTLLKERTKALVFVVEQSDKETIFSGKEAEQILTVLERKTEKSLVHGSVPKQKQIRARVPRNLRLWGTSVSYGNEPHIPCITGKVCVVLDPAKDLFKEGEILVASMTRPEYVPFMKKAKAIITDEGGVTSHAAIVSRELGIPCIVGTKTATKVLKSGMFVELDFKQGLIIQKV